MNTTKMNALMAFASTNTAVAQTIASLFKIEAQAPAKFRLAVVVADDVAEEGAGQYGLEAPVMINLLSSAYAEIVSAATRTTRKDDIPQADRARSLSGFDDTYDGAEEPELTEIDLETDLEKAITRASVISAYAHHIAAIKQGGAEWILGFDVDKYVANDVQDEEATALCLKPEADLSQLILENRVQLVKEHVGNKLPSLKTWCEEQRRNEFTSPEWKAKVARTMVQGIELDSCPVNTAMEYIGDIVAGSAFNRSTTRLEDAITRVANNRYLGLAYALQGERKSVITKTVKKVWTALPYSSMLQDDIKLVQASDEWADAQLEAEVQAEEEAQRAAARAAIRAQTQFALETRMLAIAEQSAATAGIMAGLKAQREARAAAAEAARPRTAEELAAETKAVAKAAKAKATREAKAQAKAQAKSSTAVKPNKKSAFAHLKAA